MDISDKNALELSHKLTDGIKGHPPEVALLAVTLLLASLVRLYSGGALERSLTSDEVKDCMSCWDVSTKIANNVFAK